MRHRDKWGTFKASEGGSHGTFQGTVQRPRKISKWVVSNTTDIQAGHLVKTSHKDDHIQQAFRKGE
jgi:hypothetical protein